MEFVYSLSPSAIRLLAKAGANRVMSSEEVEAFLLVHGEQLNAAVTKVARDFIIAKLKGEKQV